jgi:hypothetical protein
VLSLDTKSTTSVSAPQDRRAVASLHAASAATNAAAATTADFRRIGLALSQALDSITIGSPRMQVQRIHGLGSLK